MTHIPFQKDTPVEMEADYAVVGSGAGGSAAAITLSRAGYSVALCESGPWLDPEDYPSSVYGSMRDLWSDWGQQLALGRSLIPIVQANCVGGTTVINSAITVRTPEAVLYDWSTRLGLGEVFSPERVDGVLSRIEEELEVAQMRDSQLQPHNEMMVQALHARGMEGHAMHRSARRCEGTAQCLQGCKKGAKQSTNLSWVPEVMRRRGTVLSCAPVDRVNFEGGRAVGVRGRFRHPRGMGRGAPFHVRANRGVLVAASATGSAPLLERSGLRLPGLGLGWRAHPGCAIIGVYPFDVNMHRGTTQGACSLHFQQQGLKLESLALPLELLGARLSGAGRSLAERLSLIPRMACWVAAVRAEAEGSVRQGRLGKPVVRYAPLPADIRRVQKGLVELARLHFEAGALYVSPGIAGIKPQLGPDELHLIENGPMDNRCYTWVLTHLFGGCTMGADPRSSVVGPDLIVRGTEALHVVDASCIPTTLGVNPQHTIMAIGTIVGERLADS